MSIKSTQIGMGYVDHTTAPDTCSVCRHSYLQEQPRGRRCNEGGFFVSRTGTCRKFHNASAPATEARIQIGPTDI